MVKRAYLAGPMRNRPRFNFDAFEAAARALRAQGIDIVSPHEMDLGMGFDPDSKEPVKPEFVEECVRRDIEAIINTEGVILLDGFRHSTGATAELAVARWLQRPCYYYPYVGGELFALQPY